MVPLPHLCATGGVFPSPGGSGPAEATLAMIHVFAAPGYARVKPPLLEFEDSLLTGPGARVSRHMFLLMDPIS